MRREKNAAGQGSKFSGIFSILKGGGGKEDSSKKRKFKLTRTLVPIIALLVMLTALFQPQSAVQAAAILTINPITWNVIGLDSNNVNVGPNIYPVGARVCNTGDTTANNLTATFNWTNATNATYILSRPGSLTTLTVSSLAKGACTDFYYEVEIKRDSLSYDKTRQYSITVTADGGLSATTTTPREIYVEHLVSQSRNSTTDMLLNGVSQSAGSTFSLMVGQTYTITLVGATSTNGYNQIESYIYFPNTYFQVLSVSTLYGADDSPYVPNPNNKLYGDACHWDSNPSSPTYRSCIGGDYKAGGNVTVTYTVKIIAGAGTTSKLTSTIYDFSGSSYHYNSDFSTTARYITIIDPTAATISKSFSPSTTAAIPGTSTLTFTLYNPNNSPLTLVNFSDTFPTTPGAMTVTGAAPTYAGCGTTPSYTPGVGNASVSFSNLTLAAFGECNISIVVNVPAAGIYTNTSSHLFVGTVDTGKFATASVLGSTGGIITPDCTPGLQMANWQFNGTTLVATSINPQVSSAVASYTGTGTSAVSTTVGNPVNSWGVTGGWAANGTGYPNGGASPYFDITIDSSKFSNVAVTYDFKGAGNWANGKNNFVYTYSTANGTTPFSYIGPVSPVGFTKTDPFATNGPYSASNTGKNATTSFRINAVGAQNNTAVLYLDNITVTGCGTPVAPTIAKSFTNNSIQVNGTSTLSFTLTNTNNAVMTGISLIDSLPAGVQVATAPATTNTCGGTWAPTAGAKSLSFSGGTIAANSTCTLSVNVTATTAGTKNNATSNLGYDCTVGGSASTCYSTNATATLTVTLHPPVIAKAFSPNPIYTYQAPEVSTLTFTISNPNPNITGNELTGIGFTDTYPSNVINADQTTYPAVNNCGGTLTANTGLGSVTLAGGNNLAGGAQCTVSVAVTSTVAGTYVNTSGAVSSTNASNGNTASDTLVVHAPTPSIALLKQISTSSTGPWTKFVNAPLNSSVYYRFTVENTGDVPLSNVSVSDPALAGLLGSCTWTTIPVLGLETCVAGPVTAATGTHTNTATVTGTYNSTTVNSTSNATYSVPQISLVKSVTETAFSATGTVLHYSYLVTNNGAVSLAGPVTIVDDKTSVTCPAVSTIGNLDTNFDPGETITCSATYTTAASDELLGFVTNTATATVGAVNSNPSSATVPYLPNASDLTAVKTNNVSDTSPVGSAFTWSVLISNASGVTIGPATFANGNVIFADNLPTGATYPTTATVTPSGITGTGSIACVIASDVLTCTASGGTVVFGPSASATVAFSATPTAANTLANPASTGLCKVDPNGLIVELNEANNTCANSVTVTKLSPSIATSLSSTSIAVGSSANDTSTLSGATSTAGGTVDYYYYSNNTCSANQVHVGQVTVTNAVVPNSSSVTFNTAGTYYWQAVYSGDANNNTTTSLCTSEQITVNKLSPSINTVLSSASIPVGSSANDTADLSGATATAGGTVDYYYYSDNVCSLNQVHVGQVTVTNGVVPNSSSATFNTAGTFYWQAVYSGDSNNDAATSVCTSEEITVNKLSPSISTTLSSSSILVGNSANDTATLTGVTATASGTVDYYYYTDNACSLYQVHVGQVTVTNGVVPNSASTTFNTAGTYYWQAVYSGDANNNTATSLCTSEQITVNKLSPSISTLLSSASIPVSSSANDTATLTGATTTAGGTVDYYYYTDNACSLGQVNVVQVTVTNGIVPNSSSVTFNTAGTYFWQAVYSGDANNNSATSLCTSEEITVNKLTPTISTLLSVVSIPVGSSANDTATLSGATGAAGGTVDYYYYTDNTCSANQVHVGQVTVTNGVVPNSSSVTFNTAGTFYWQASYSGDANNSSAISTCTDEILTVGKLTPTVTTDIHDQVENTGISGEVAGNTFHDQATVTGSGPTPTGSVSFDWFLNGACTGTPTSAGTVALVSGIAHPSSSEGPLAAGSYSFMAHYSGDDVYTAASSDCEPLSTWQIGSSVTTAIHDSSETVITAVPADSTVHDSAKVNGLFIPTGSVDFTWFSNGTCSGTGVSAGSVTLNGSGIAHPSSSEGPLAAGSYSFKAHYSGSLTFFSSDSACEPLTVIDPPSISKAFGDVSISQSATSSLTFTITNPNTATALTGVAFTDVLPAGLTVPSASTAQCGGTLTVTSPDTINLAGASIAASGTCTFAVTVTGETAGIKNNTTGNVSSTNGGTGNTASASITVAGVTQPVTGSKWFTPEQIKAGENSRLSILIYPPTDTTLSNISLTDHLPAGIVISNSSPAEVTCLVGNTGTLTAVTGSDTVTWTGGALYSNDPSVSVCRIDVWVTGDTVALYTNTIDRLLDFSNNEGRTFANDLTYNLDIIKATPAVTTTLSSTSVDVGGTIHDSATLSGVSPTAGGTVTYTVYSDNACTLGATPTGTALVTNGVAGDSDPIQFNAAGTYFWQAAYSGDSNNAAAISTCTDEILTVNKLSPTISTLLSDPTIVVGNTAYDTSALSGATGDASGTVTYSIYSDNTCTTLVGTAGTKDVTAGVVPASDAFQFDNAGDYYWQAVYSGDTNNNGTTSTCTDEHLVVTPTSPTVSTLLSLASINVGDSAFDSATILGTTSDAGGSIAYNVYTDSACTNLYQATASKPVVNGIAPDSDAVTFTAAGTYYWKALYSGDYVNNGSAESICGDEILEVNAIDTSITTLLSSTSIPVGASASDSATLSGATSDAGGFVTYNIYSDSSCSVSVASGGTKSVTNGSVPDSNSITFNTAGTFYWQAIYSGDSNNNGSTSGCTEEQITVIAPPRIDKSFTPGSIIVGDTSILTFTITNPNASTDLTGVAFNDFLPAGVFVPDGGPIAQCGGLLESISPDWIRLSGATIAAGGTCSFDVTVTGLSTGIKNNTSGSVTSTESGAGNTASASLTVGKATPSITTSASPNTGNVATRNTFGDTATLTGGDNPTGLVYFTLYSDSDCTQPVLGISGQGTVSSGQASWSSPWIPSYVQTYYWQAAYTGDANNNSVTTGCTDANEQIVVGKAAATVETTIHDASHNAITSVLLGTTVHDSAAVTSSGGFGTPSGNVYFSWYTNGTCTGTGTSGANIALDAGVAHPSETHTPSTAGSYSFKAFYGGDSVFDPAESPCEPLTIQPAPAAVKSLTFTNQEGSDGSQVYVGEILTYQVTLTLYPGTVNSLKLVDTLDEGLAFVGCDSITFDTLDTGGNPCGSETVTAVGSNGEVDNGRQVEWNFGTIANKGTVPHTLTVTYRVVVLDSSANVRGKTLRNSAVWSWADVNNPTGPAVSLQPVQSTPVTIIEPSLAISKSISPTTVANGGQTTVTIVITHAPVSNADAFDMTWVDPLPANTEYVPGTISFAGLAPTTHDETNIYNLTAAWDVFPLGSTSTITFKIKVTLTGGISATNTTSVSWTSLPGNIVEPQSTFNLLSTERFYDPQSPINVYGASTSAAINGRPGTVVPPTGFAPGIVTPLSKQPADMAYVDTGSLYLDIPTLGQYMKIVGVPQTGNSWDITWLGRQAGYLQGTAFPTWNGNSVITAHVYDSNGYPGPFVNLASLKWGDKVIVHAYGTKYIYEVREVLKTTSTDSSLLQHEDKPWVTLITCQGYNAKTGAYAWRIGVRAVLVQTLPDK